MRIQAPSPKKKQNPPPYFKPLKQSIKALKSQVEAFNKWQNNFSTINLSNHKISYRSKIKLLKNITQSKYQKNIQQLFYLQQLKNYQQNQLEFGNLHSIRSLLCNLNNNIQQTTNRQININNLISLQPIQLALPNICSPVQKLKQNQIRINIKKKHKILQKNWNQLQNYRSQHSIHDTQGIFPQTKKQKIIINKVFKNRIPFGSMEDSQGYLRKNTFQTD